MAFRRLACVLLLVALHARCDHSNDGGPASLPASAKDLAKEGPDERFQSCYGNYMFSLHHFRVSEKELIFDCDLELIDGPAGQDYPFIIDGPQVVSVLYLDASGHEIGDWIGRRKFGNAQLLDGVTKRVSHTLSCPHNENASSVAIMLTSNHPILHIPRRAFAEDDSRAKSTNGQSK